VEELYIQLMEGEAVVLDLMHKPEELMDRAEMVGILHLTLLIQHAVMEMAEAVQEQTHQYIRVLVLKEPLFFII
jgi:hypothetical protein